MATATTYRCDDGNCPLDIEASSAQEAAEEYFEAGSWAESDPEDGTYWVRVRVWELVSDGNPADDEEATDHLFEVKPLEPDCESAAQRHQWEHHSCRGNGGGVIVTEVCGRCGLLRHTDTWAQLHDTGEQAPGDRVSYAMNDDDE